MGFTDTPQQEDIKDIYPPGTAFLVKKAWIEGVVPTQFGNRTLGKVEIAAADAPDQGREFSVWGSLAEQIQAAEEGEFPMLCTLVQESRRWLFKPATTENTAAPGTTPPPAAKRHDPAPHVDANAEGVKNPVPPPAPPGPAPTGDAATPNPVPQPGQPVGASNPDALPF